MTNTLHDPHNRYGTAQLLSTIYVLLCLSIGVLSHAEPAQDDLLSINMRNADISSVIQWIAEQTNKKIVVDPRVQGKVTVLANQPMTADHAYEVFLAMLDVYGYAAAESGGILRIFPAVMVKSSPGRLVNDFSKLGSAEHILYVFKANNVSVTELAKTLKPLVPATGFMSAHAQSNSLIIADESANVKRLVTMMGQIDTAGSIDIEVLKLNHASAKNVAGVVDSLLDADDKKTFAITADERSNSVLMSGDTVTKRRVTVLIQQLDKPISASGNTRVVYLHYLDAKEVLPILKGMSESILKSTKQDTNNTSINIEASESANALVMTAPPDMLDAMEKVIKKIDIRRAQVLLEAIIVEVNKDFTQSLGVEWNTSLSSQDGVETITNFGLKGVNTSDGTVSFVGSGLSLGFFHNGSLRALAQALASETDANILSTPSILTLDNQEAEILVGSNVPFLSGQSQGTPGTDDDGNSFQDPFTTIERHDIGVTLRITPQINEGDSVTLDVLQEIESITESTLVSSDIVTNKRSIKTKVLVEDETILVLGGLISDETREIVKKVPVLGDLPLVGTLFQSTTDTKAKKNLMVFIHPVIIKQHETAHSMSKKNYEYMQSVKEKYNSGKFFSDEPALKDFEHYTPRKKQQSTSKK